jgi:hypothetical protein
MKYNLIAVVLLGLVGCNGDDEPVQAKNVQAERAKQVANSITFTENAEIDNIKKRLELTANPGLLGYVVLLNEMGQPIMYTAVKGKITSGGKRLTEPDRIQDYGYGQHGGSVVRSASSDEGTYGSSGEYVFFWTPGGQYIQWNGKFLYSDKPFRLTTEPLVLDVNKPERLDINSN